MNLNKWHLNSDFIDLIRFKTTANRLYLIYIYPDNSYYLYKLVDKNKYILESSNSELFSDEQNKLDHDLIHRLYLSYRYNTNTPSLLYD